MNLIQKLKTTFIDTDNTMSMWNEVYEYWWEYPLHSLFPDENIHQKMILGDVMDDKNFEDKLNTSIPDKKLKSIFEKLDFLPIIRKKEEENLKMIGKILSFKNVRYSFLWDDENDCFASQKYTNSMSLYWGCIDKIRKEILDLILIPVVKPIVMTLKDKEVV